jgi:oligopeptide transport system substrate-binding protein
LRDFAAGGCYAPKVHLSFRRPLTLLLSLTLVAAACGGNGGTEEPENAAPAEFDLRVAVTDPGSLDPPKIATDSATLIARQVCDTLVSFDQQTGALRLGLAQSWTVAPDARKVTFLLRPGAKFHNGREVVAEDFVYSMSRLADPKTGSNQHFLLDKVAGYTEMRAGRAPQLTGVRAVDPRTLEVDLTEPFAEFPTVMTTIAAGSAVPREEVERSADEFATRPVCTGPYEVESPKSGEGMRLVRDADYHGANEGYLEGGRGFARAIDFRFVESEADAYQLLDNGEVDVSPVPARNLAAAGQVEGRVTSGPNGHVSYIGLPVKKAPFDNVNLRRAMALAVDREEIITGLLGDSRGTPNGFLPPSAGPQASAGRCPEVIGETADVSAAQAAAAEEGVGVPETVIVYLNSGGGHEQWLQNVVDQWDEALGISGTLKPDEWQPYIDYLAGTGADGPFRLAWTVEYPSPEALFAPLFSSASLDNYSRYSSPEFDAAMNKARATVDDAQRAQAYAEAGSHLCRDVPIIPIWFGRNHLAFGEGVEAAGATRIDIFGDPVLRELRKS